MYITRVYGVGYIIICHLILFGANYSPCQHPQLDWYCLPTFKRKGLKQEGMGGAALQITVGHWQLPIVWKYWLAKKLGNYKNDQPLFTHKKRDFKTTKPEISFFPNFIIQIHLKLLSTIFHQIFIFHQKIALQKLWKMLLSFLRYLKTCLLFFLLSTIALEVDSRKNLKFMMPSTV